MPVRRMYAMIGVCIFIVIFPFFKKVSANDNRVFRYAWEPWQPYQMKNEQGRLTGLDIEILEAILNGIGQPFKWQKTPWKRVIKDIQEGYLDAGLGASVTEERQQWAYFSEPYRKESVVLFLLKDIKQIYQFVRLEDITDSDITLGMTRGYYYGGLFEKLSKDPKFISRFEEVKINELNYEKLKMGRIDGFLSDPVAGTAGLKKLGLLDKVEIHPMHIYSDNIHVMFSKKSVPEEYIQKFNQSLLKLKTSGEHTKIISKYLK